MHRLLAYRLPLESKLLLNVRDCADEYGQPGGIVDDGIDERPVEDNTAPIFPNPCGRRLNRGCRARLCALFIHGDMGGLQVHPCQHRRALWNVSDKDQEVEKAAL